MNSNDNKDRLSELPEELLVRILSFLPIKQAVRTMLLRRFGNLWTLLRTLEFDGNLDDERFICNVLKYHQNPVIDAFELPSITHGYSEENLANWITFAIKKKTKELIIFVFDDSYKIPPCLFTSHCIVSLSIENARIQLPQQVVSMGSLTKLELVYVLFGDEPTLETITSGCPCLRELIIADPYGLQNVHFTAPNIEKLVLGLSDEVDDRMEFLFKLDCPYLKILHINGVYLETLRFINVSSVRECFIINCDYDQESPVSSHHFEELLGKFRNPDFFQLQDKAYLQLKPCRGERLAFQKNDWVRLTLRSGIHGSCLLNICSLLKKSLCLKKLIIYADMDYFCDCNMILHELKCRCVMRKLKVITIREYEKPWKGLLDLIKFLLKSAVALDKMVISCNRKDQLISTEGHEFLFQLLSFPRASSKASIVFA